MADTTRSGWSFTAGVMVGGAVALWASFAWLLPAMGPGMRPDLAGAGQPSAALSTQLAPSEAAPAGRAAAGAPPTAAACGFEPMLAPVGARDGRFTLDAAAPGDPPSVRGYVAAARDAARQGRSRDSEVALLVACRLAAGKSPLVSVPVADVQSLLGRRYLEAAAAEPDESVRTAILERAEGLLEQSLLAYTVVLGSQASKSRMAARRVAVLSQLRHRQDRFATAGPDGALLTPESAALATLGAGAPTPWGGLELPQAGDAGAVRAAGALIRSDPELTRMEADLARLQAQAASVTRDPAGLRQRSDRALAQRDAQCRDKPCLLRWYAQRKRELFAEF